MSEEVLIPAFIPALVAILINVEDKKQSPLTKEEVIAIRDSASVIMLPKAEAEAMNESRGYCDIDPENCWYDWQIVRRDLGRKPDIDPGARFSFSNAKDPAVSNSIALARESLDVFRRMLPSQADFSPLIKIKLVEPNYSAYMWLIVTETTATNFTAELFEVPTEFTSFKVGDSFTVSDQEVFDWMINDNGTLYGGYSLRAHREKMSEPEKARFDDHIGVTKYADFLD